MNASSISPALYTSNELNRNVLIPQCQTKRHIKEVHSGQVLLASQYDQYSAYGVAAKLITIIHHYAHVPYLHKLVITITRWLSYI